MGINVAGLGSLTAGARQQDDIILIVDKHDFTQGPTGTTKIITVANLFTNVIGAGTMSWAGAVTLASTLGVTGAVTAASFAGAGTSLTALNATNLTSGTVPSARVAGSYTGITSVGTLGSLAVTAGVTAATFAGSGASLTTLNASNLASGTVASARLAGSYTGITAIGTLATLGVTGNAAIGGSVNAAGLTSTSGAVITGGFALIDKIKGGSAAATASSGGDGTVTVTGTDLAGKAIWQPNASIGPQTLTFTFSAAFTTAPFVVCSYGGPASSGGAYFTIQVSTISTTGFSLLLVPTGANFVNGNPYTLYFHVIQ